MTRLPEPLGLLAKKLGSRSHKTGKADETDL